MSMVVIYELSCCKGREMVYGRFRPPEGTTKYPETLCPLCFKKITLTHGRYAEEHVENIPYVHKYVLPENVEVLF